MSHFSNLCRILLSNSKNNLQSYEKHCQVRSLFTTFIAEKNVAFNLSDIGEGIREVVIKEWFVKVGDKVSQFDNICEVQSDKASVTITSRYDGIITKLHYNIDDTALVGKPLVDLDVDGQDDSKSAEMKEKFTPDVDIQPTSISTSYIKEDKKIDPQEGKEILCIPSVRRLAKEHKINLSRIMGSGKNGRILKEDIIKYLETDGDSITQKRPVNSDSKIEPISGFRKAMLKTMTEALKIPHFVYSDEITVTKLSDLRKELQSIEELRETKITFMPFFIKALSNALLRYPLINSSLDEKCENVIYHKHHNVGVAMDTTAGLAVPVIKHVESLSVTEIAVKLKQLSVSGKKGVFAPDDLTGGTISISNIGIVGGTYTKPVILPPQVAILAIGRSKTLPRFDQTGSVIAEQILNVSASADHRIVDGATMANFIRTVKRQIENPYLLLLNL
ncbi:lipoamide acyltransferase component of branched-chain alpha-keto acid dehydrogenase complex, mitochondrial [Cylas formicarius]|uniref:lipoamide acyltransferase component of branched-chain alpha-keto acid dehydrogenase complex, mitochondrial n=1 Tax=Cylas formicarius TaxID=197179 RepID=UPI002958C3E0|nr:lipoamide acyltransferase component of branched-chain alpha-keto acid dehydrogenase complex, mitochondrial [Cylas formicarius]